MNEIQYDGPGSVTISGIDAVREQGTSDFDCVITVCQDEVSDNVSDDCAYFHFNMSDGPDNQYGGDSSYEMFERAADTLYDMLEGGESVLIHCHHGQSRSVSVTIAVLGSLLEIPRYEALDLVERYRPQAHPDMLLMDHARQYIEEHTGQ